MIDREKNIALYEDEIQQIVSGGVCGSVTREDMDRLPDNAKRAVRAAQIAYRCAMIAALSSAEEPPPVPSEVLQQWAAISRNNEIQIAGGNIVASLLKHLGMVGYDPR
jgi:hypothetical protein